MNQQITFSSELYRGACLGMHPKLGEGKKRSLACRRHLFPGYWLHRSWMETLSVTCRLRVLVKRHQGSKSPLYSWHVALRTLNRCLVVYEWYKPPKRVKLTQPREGDSITQGAPICPVSIISLKETLMKWEEYSKYVSVSSWTFLPRFYNGENPVPMSKAYFLGSM